MEAGREGKLQQVVFYKAGRENWGMDMEEMRKI